LTAWENGSPLSAEEKAAIRERIVAAVEYLNIPHVFG
jgi:hypothetical protein